jgi:hypothetical protein
MLTIGRQTNQQFVRREANSAAPLDEQGTLGDDWRNGDFTKDALILG